MTTMLKSTTPASKTTKVSYPYYGNITTTEVDYQELECKEIAKADHIYPNLVTQAAHAVEGIERWNNEIQKSATRLFDQLGSETLHAQLEGIYSYLATEVDSMEDGEIIEKGLLDSVLSRIFSLVEFTKTLLDIYLANEYLRDEARTLKYAQRKILM